MDSIDKKQQFAISLLIAGLGIVSSIVAIMAYRSNKKHQQIQKEVLNVDKEIKLLQLAREKQKAKSDGLI